MIPANEARIEELLKVFGDEEFVAHSAVDLYIDPYKHDLGQVYSNNVQLMAKLDGFNQVLAEEMSRVLQEIKRGENRSKYQFNLLKSDVHNFDQRQAQVVSQIQDQLKLGPENEAALELAALKQDREKIQAVLKVLEEKERGSK